MSDSEPDPNPFAAPCSPSAVRVFDVEAEREAIERRTTRRRTCLRALGVMAILGGAICIPVALDYLHDPVPWRRWAGTFALIDVPLFVGLGIWCLAGRPAATYAAAICSLLWLGQGYGAWREVPKVDPVLAAQPIPYSTTYAPMSADLERIGKILATLPAIVPLGVASYAIFLDQRIRRRRGELDRFAALAAAEGPS